MGFRIVVLLAKSGFEVQSYSGIRIQSAYRLPTFQIALAAAGAFIRDSSKVTLKFANNKDQSVPTIGLEREAVAWGRNDRFSAMVDRWFPAPHRHP